MRRGLAAAAAGVVVALSSLPLFAAGAQAQTQNKVTVTYAPLTMTPAPGANGTVTTNQLSVSGHFHVGGGVNPNLDWVSINFSWAGNAPGPPTPGPYTVCGTPPSGTPGAACTGNDEVFNKALLPAPTYNGPYKVSATAKASDQLTGGADSATTNEIDFNIAAPPDNVTGVVATFDSKAHQVFLSWDRDGTPDVRTYYIYRKAAAEKDFGKNPVGQTFQTSSGARITNVADTPPTAGDYVYAIEARRNGGDGGFSTTDYVASDRTQSESTKVTFTPAPGQSTPPTTAPASGGAPPVVTGTPSGPSKTSTFSGSGSSSGSSSISTTPTSLAVTPDPGFVRGLPYAGSNANDQNGEGDNSAIAVTPGRHSSSSGGKGYLVPVAGAAVLVLGAVHMRIFKKRLDEPPTNLTPV